jgi:Spy/CpxP family protein refolding chaperone
MAPSTQVEEKRPKSKHHEKYYTIRPSFYFESGSYCNWSCTRSTQRRKWRRSANPPNQERAGRGGRALTPEQRQQIQAQAQQRRELSVRAALTTAGFTEAALQDAVVAYSTEKEKATQALQGKARTLTQAMRTTTTTDAQIAALLNDFRAAVEEEKAQRATAQTALAAQIGLATKPRLDALLMMMGLTGDEAQYLGSGRGFGGGNGRGNGRGDRGGAQN